MRYLPLVSAPEFFPLHFTSTVAWEELEVGLSSEDFLDSMFSFAGDGDSLLLVLRFANETLCRLISTGNTSSELSIPFAFPAKKILFYLLI